MIRSIREEIEGITDCIPVNREFELDERTHLFAMMCRKNGEPRAFIFSHWSSEDDPQQEEQSENETNRMSIYRGLQREQNALMSAKSFELCGKRLDIISANSTVMDYDNALIKGTALITMMLQKGVNFGELEKCPPSNMRLYEFVLDEASELSFPGSRENPGDKFAINFGRISVTVPVKQKLTAQFNQAKTRKYVLNDEMGTETIEFFVDGLIVYDIWDEAETRFDTPRFVERFSEEERARIKKDYIEHLPDICPQGMCLAVLEYETDDDIQLQFYSERFLAQKPEHKSSASFLMLKAEKELGPNGRRLRACVLEPVPKDADGEIEIELVNYYKHFPESRIEL